MVLEQFNQSPIGNDTPNPTLPDVDEVPSDILDNPVQNLDETLQQQKQEVAEGAQTAHEVTVQTTEAISLLNDESNYNTVVESARKIRDILKSQMDIGSVHLGEEFDSTVDNLSETITMLKESLDVAIHENLPQKSDEEHKASSDAVKAASLRVEQLLVQIKDLLDVKESLEGIETRVIDGIRSAKQIMSSFNEMMSGMDDVVNAVETFVGGEVDQEMVDIKTAAVIDSISEKVGDFDLVKDSEECEDKCKALSERVGNLRKLVIGIISEDAGSFFDTDVIEDLPRDVEPPKETEVQLPEPELDEQEDFDPENFDFGDFDFDGPPAMSDRP